MPGKEREECLPASNAGYDRGIQKNASRATCTGMKHTYIKFFKKQLFKRILAQPVAS
ncbi:unnamed protein product [Amoebophrya sp. A120]|nr:unnamed protein product [Amoebophrya sp. A120]|eukprot:GSA120T00005697001.1